MIALIFVGVAGGVLSGMLGVGGGIVMVPLLLALTKLDQRQASSVSLLAILPSSLVGAIGYFLTGSVDWYAAIFTAIGGVVGGVLGARIAKRLSLTWLRWLFIGFLLAIAARMIFVVPVRGVEHLDHNFGTIAALVSLGLAVGIAAGLFGIGGGIVMVPVFIALFGMSDLLAKGTSLVAMIPTVAAGSATHIRHGTVDIKFGVITGIGAAAGSIPGVWLAHLIPPAIAAWLFLALVAISVTQLTFRAVRYI